MTIKNRFLNFIIFYSLIELKLLFFLANHRSKYKINIRMLFKNIHTKMNSRIINYAIYIYCDLIFNSIYVSFYLRLLIIFSICLNYFKLNILILL